MNELKRLSLTAETPKEQVLQIRSYLFQLVEELEFILDSIDEQNFTTAFAKRLDGMQANHVIVDKDPGIGAVVNYADGTIILVKET